MNFGVKYQIKHLIIICPIGSAEQKMNVWNWNLLTWLLNHKTTQIPHQTIMKTPQKSPTSQRRWVTESCGKWCWHWLWYQNNFKKKRMEVEKRFWELCLGLYVMDLLHIQEDYSPKFFIGRLQHSFLIFSMCRRILHYLNRKICGSIWWIRSFWEATLQRSLKVRVGVY